MSQIPAEIDRLIRAFTLDQQRRGLLATTIDKRRICLRAFGTHNGSLLLVSREQIEQFLDARNLAPRTRYAWVSHLHIFFVWAKREGFVSDDPTEGIVRPKLRRLVPRPISDKDLRHALAHADRTMLCWLMLAAYAGLRCQEIAGVQRGDVLDEDDPPMLVVTHAKGANERMVPLADEVVAALRSFGMPPRGYLFRRPQGGKFHPADVSKLVADFLRDLNIDATGHQARHWFGSRLYQQTRDLRLTQELMGHASPTTTAVYTAWAKGPGADAVRALPLCAG